MTTRREFVKTVGAITGAALVPASLVAKPKKIHTTWSSKLAPNELEIMFDLKTMETHGVYPLSTPLEELWPPDGDQFTHEFLHEHDAWRLTQAVIDYLRKENIDAYLITRPLVLIDGKPYVAKSKKFAARPELDLEELGKEFASLVTRYANPLDPDQRFRSIGIMGFGSTPHDSKAEPGDKWYGRRGIIGRYCISANPVDEILHLAELTRRHS